MENLADLLGFALLVLSLLAGAGAFLQEASVLSKNNLPGVAVVVVVAAIGVALIAIPPQKEDENGGLAQTTEERGKDSATEEEVQDATASERPATSPTDTPCTPTELSPAAVELVRLYEELHTFKDDTEFLDRGFSPAGPYHAWMEAVEAHQDANPGWVLFHELGFAANEVLMLGMNYIDEDPNASDLSAVEFFETKIQAGLALTRCAEPETAVQDIARASAEARRAYVPSVDRPPAGADDIDERVINPCIAAAAQNDLGDIEPWTLRNVYPEKFDPVEAQMRALADEVLALVETELPEFGARARNIILDRLRDDCIRGARGEETLDWSEAEVRELLSISQEEATQYELPLLNVNGEPYFPGERCDSPWVEHTPIASWMDPFDTGWLCESRLPRKRFCWTEGGGQGAACSSRDADPEQWERVAAAEP